MSKNLGKKKAAPAGGFDKGPETDLKRMKSCPLRRKDMEDDEECLACGS